MRVLVACEYSGRVRDAFLARGFRAVSCDILPTDVPGPHYQGDVMDIIDDGWDLLIAHPPCTYLTIAAEWCYADNPKHKTKPGTLIGAERRQARQEALTFIDTLFNADIKHIAIENPRGVINKRLPHMPKPQWIQPYMFGDDASKNTGLWLKNLPPLVTTDYVEPRMVNGKPRWANQTDSGQNRLPPSEDRWKIRSETYLGIAAAMAQQWGDHICNEKCIEIVAEMNT